MLFTTITDTLKKIQKSKIKNKKVKISNVSFDGNHNFSDAKLKGKLKKSGERVRINLFKASGIG